MYEGMLVIRIFQGLGSSVSETLGPVVVGEMFFVRERGRWMVGLSFLFLEEERERERDGILGKLINDADADDLLT